MADASNYTDANSAIVDRCKKGERKAFQEIYSLYAKAMFNVSLRILNNTGEAEDVLQESFIKAFKNIDNYNNRYSFGAWLKRIVINSSLDTLKKRKLNIVPISDKDYSEEAYTEEENFYDAETIKRCIKQLPDGYRTILLLFLFEDYSHKAIAELLGISEGTSKSQYNRARKKLGELIKQNTVSHER